MKKLLIFLVIGLPFVSLAEEYQSTLLVQTGKLQESDLIVRIITDLESSKTCLTFYIRTPGTSPEMICYDAAAGFRSHLDQVGQFKEGEVVVRKLKDSVNNVACLVAYVRTPGTSPAINCYKRGSGAKDSIVRNAHLREGDLHVYRIMDPDGTKTCLVAYVSTQGSAPSLECYNSKTGGKGGMVQNDYLREGDLVARKIVDSINSKACLITYVSTEGTSPYIYCFDERSGVAPATGTQPPAAKYPPLPKR